MFLRMCARLPSDGAAGCARGGVLVWRGVRSLGATAEIFLKLATSGGRLIEGGMAC